MYRLWASASTFFFWAFTTGTVVYYLTFQGTSIEDVAIGERNGPGRGCAFTSFALGANPDPSPSRLRRSVPRVQERARRPQREAYYREATRSHSMTAIAV